MKHDVMPSRVQMEPEVFKKLTAEVKETVAIDFDLTETKTAAFRAINLWKIHRNQKSASIRWASSL